jgi:hypothetical protein
MSEENQIGLPEVLTASGVTGSGSNRRRATGKALNNSGHFRRSGGADPEVQPNTSGSTMSEFKSDWTSGSVNVRAPEVTGDEQLAGDWSHNHFRKCQFEPGQNN